MRKKGFTLIELLTVMLVVGIIFAAGIVTYNTVWRNHQTDTAETELRDISGGISNYLIDYGNINLPNDINFETALNETIDTLNKQYLNYEIEKSDIAADKKSVRLVTRHKTDPWKNKYNLYIYTYNGDDKTSIPGLVIISSNGVDGVSSKATYKDGNYGDDIAAVVEPK